MNVSYLERIFQFVDLNPDCSLEDLDDFMISNNYVWLDEIDEWSVFDKLG